MLHLLKFTLLEACATYLGFTVRENETEKKLYKNQRVLCDKMILKIETLFDIDCAMCKETYCNELTDETLLKCRLCLQGSHNCEAMIEKAKALNQLIQDGTLPPGTSWQCFGCDKKNDTSLQQVLTSKPTSSAEAALHPIKEEGEAEVEKNEDDANDGESPSRGREEIKNDINETETTSSKICKEYIMRRCPHGLTGKRLIEGKRCPFQHPIRCRYYTQYGNDKHKGCNKMKDCTFYNPKLCRDSVSQRCCLNKECGYVHLKGTARKTVGSATAINDRQNSLQQQQQRQQQQQQAQPRQRLESYSNQNNRGQWPPLNSYDPEKMGSLYSVYTPHPPTVENGRPARRHKDRTSEKDGIISQMDSKMTELRSQLPSIIQETQWTLQRPRSHQGPIQMPLSMPPTAPMVIPNQPHHMPMNLIPNYPASCF